MPKLSYLILCIRLFINIIHMVCIHPHCYQKLRIYYTGQSFIWLSQMLPENISIGHAVKKSLQCHYVQEWDKIVSCNSKCVLYRIFKRNFVFENYLTTLSLYSLIENYCVNLELLTINCQILLDGLVATQDLRFYISLVYQVVT